MFYFRIAVACVILFWFLLMINAIKLYSLSRRLKSILSPEDVVMNKALIHKLNPIAYMLKTIEVNKKDSQKVRYIKLKLKPVVHRHFVYMFFLLLMIGISALCLYLVKTLKI